MIVFDLHCEHGHRFEGWFRSSSDYEGQRERNLVNCPQCGTCAVSKAPMAPAVSAKGNRLPEPSRSRPHSEDEGGEIPAVSNMPTSPEVQKALAALAQAQAKALENSTWVGKDFARQSREMHYGERDETAIHGQASLEEAKALVSEGVPVAPLPFPVAPPDELN
jgi:hypothetical protein